VADYSVDIALKVKGQRQIKDLTKAVNEINKNVKKLVNITKQSSKTIPVQIEKINKKFNKTDKELKKIKKQAKETRKELERLGKIPDSSSRNRVNNNRRGGGRFSNAIGSGIIGGGFPLLFGQGGTAAVGGAVGGLAGGVLGGQFGFALSIAGTTIGAAVDDLALALARPTENIGNLVEKLNLTNKPTGKLILELEKLGLTTSATNLVLDKFSEITGKTPEELQKTTDSLNVFKDDITKLGLQLTIFGAEVIGPIVATLNKIPYGQIKEKLRPFLDTILYGPGGATQINKELKNVEAKQNFPIDNSFAANRGLTRNANSPAEIGAAITKERLFFNREILPLKQALELEKNRFNLTSQQLKLKKEIFTLDNLKKELEIAVGQQTGEVNNALNQRIQKLRASLNLQQQIVDNAKALVEPFKQVANMIQIEMGNGIKDLIKGTRTLGDVLNNVLNKMIDGFLNLALFGNFGGGSITGGLLGAIFKADGGSVKAGGSYIVGERGPELFSPGVSGTITPNHALGGSTNVVVNVDASGSSVEGDEAQGRELGRLISVAVQSEIVQQQRPGGLLA
jgi:hypothetical protein